MSADKSKKIKKIVVISAISLLAIAIIGFIILSIRKDNRIYEDIAGAQDLYPNTLVSGSVVSNGGTNSTNVTSGSNNDDGDTDTDTDTDGDVSSENTTSSNLNPETGISRDFDQLYELNTDIKGWIQIPNTGLDLPVYQGKDNDYYLYRNYKQETTALGVPFIDWRATLTENYQSTNLTIYGHSANNGTFFAPVKEYVDIEFYKSNPIITFNTIYGDAQYKIIGFFMEDVNVNNPKIFAYHDKIEMNEAEFNSYIAETNKRTYFDTTVDVEYGDKLITLSTCQQSGTTDLRYVLVARMVREGESTSVDVANATINKDMIMPDTWVQSNGKANPYS